MSATININGRTIGTGEDVFIIAEVGINHNGDYGTAKQLIDEAYNAGASAVKFQTYITEKRVPKDSPIYGILEQCELDFEQQDKLFDYARSKDIEVFSTPFDDESVEFLESINISCYKIASFDLVNTNLLKKVAGQNKPIIMSRGMANQTEIDKAVNIIRDSGSPFSLLHCVSAYPVKSHTDLNLSTIKALAEVYHCPVGFSDHTLGTEAAIYAIAAGASILEKHFTLSRESDGPDHTLSTEPSELKDMIRQIKHVQEMMGKAVWESLSAEKDILQYRRMT